MLTFRSYIILVLGFISLRPVLNTPSLVYSRLTSVNLRLFAVHCFLGWKDGATCLRSSVWRPGSGYSVYPFQEQLRARLGVTLQLLGPFGASEERAFRRILLLRLGFLFMHSCVRWDNAHGFRVSMGFAIL